MAKTLPLPACTECGMIVKLGEYHPFAACLMYKGCKDEKTVRENMKAVTTQWTALGNREAQAKILQLLKSDNYAISFQSMGQYRSALIKEIQLINKDAT